MLLRIIAIPLAALALGHGLLIAADAPKKKAAPAVKKVTGKSAARPAATKGRYTAATRPRTATSYAKGRTQGRSPQPVPVRRYRGQQTPTQERVVEIQQALVKRGYLESTPSGVWDTPTTNAMKRFQEEQNLPPTGKISAISLIGLGLGPKRNPLTAATAQAPSPAVP